MAYVDLNPVRAQMADSPENSDHTSIQRRIQHAKEGRIPADLMRFQGNAHRDWFCGIPMRLEHYVELIDWTGRFSRTGKRGGITENVQPILKRIGISEETWFTLTCKFETSFSQWVGSEDAIRRVTRNMGKTRSRSPPIPSV